MAGRIAEFRRMLVERVSQTTRSDRAVGAIGLEIEREAHAITNELGRELMAEAIRMADTQAPEVTVGGEAWGARKVNPGVYTTIFGEVKVERSTYQRSGRGRVLVPAEVRLGMVEGAYTPMAARIVTRSVACMPSGEAEELLSEIGVCMVSRSTIDRLPKAILARVGGDLERIERDVRVRDVIPEEAVSVQVGMDGVMLPMEGEEAKRRGRKTQSPQPPRHEGRHGATAPPSLPTLEEAEEEDATTTSEEDTKGRAWKEASVGTVSFWDKDGEHLKTIYLAEMPESGKLSLVMRLEAELRAVVAERPDLRPVLASDGAPNHWTSLRAMAGRVFGEGTNWTELLDYFHAASRLGNAANDIWGAGEEALVIGEHWKTTLRERTNGAATVLKALEYQRSIAAAPLAKKLTTAMKYLATHKKAGRLRYAEAKKAHLPIGTGVTEAAAKTVVAVRMKRSGARYEDHGGQVVLTFRTALLSGRFSTLLTEIESSYTATVAA